MFSIIKQILDSLSPRETVLCIKMTVEEKEELRTRADYLNLTLQEYVRAKLFITNDGK